MKRLKELMTMPIDESKEEFQSSDELDLEQELYAEEDSGVEEGHSQMGSVNGTYEFLTGEAGTGKTYEIRSRMERSPRDYVLAATTGIAAVNMGPGVTTINSLLKFFNYKSLVDRFIKGTLTSTIANLVRERKVKTLVIDEVSMLSARSLDLIVKAVQMANEQRTVGWPLNLILTGDFCQLPVIPDTDQVTGKKDPESAKMAFQAECWPLFAKNTTRLTKNWRQADAPEFVEALRAARRGDGKTCAAMLREAGVEFVEYLDQDYDGTTIAAINREVDNYNTVRLMKETGASYTLRSHRWGTEEVLKKPPSEWKDIPDQNFIKVGAYVMILFNETSNWSFVNGDCGWIEEVTAGGWVKIRLARTDERVVIPRITRTLEIPGIPEYEGLKEAWHDMTAEEKEPFIFAKTSPKSSRPTYPHYDAASESWVHGAIMYHPLRLAYASTVHKTQGLTLPKVQVDIRAKFFGSPGMVYVALSRCRDPKNIRIVGTPELLAERCNTDERVKEWL